MVRVSACSAPRRRPTIAETAAPGPVHGSHRVSRGAVVSADDDCLSRVGQARSDDVRQADVDYGVGTTGEIQQEAGGIVRVVLVLVGLLATPSVLLQRAG
jgi:hypothetical protein